MTASLKFPLDLPVYGRNTESILFVKTESANDIVGKGI